MKINYGKIFDDEIKKISKTSQKPTLLLHACCAPCSSAVLEVLKDYFKITIYFYNPNISPKEEFDFRLAELNRLLNEMNLSEIKVVAPDYDNAQFEQIAKGLEDMPEGSARCFECYRLRLSKSVKYADENGFDYVTTTLTVSPHKNAQVLNEIGLELSQDKKTKYLCSDFKKHEGYKRSCELSAVYNLYRQNYCGCIYSKLAAENKAQKNT